jgi:hypothetical protein
MHIHPYYKLTDTCKCYTDVQEVVPKNFIRTSNTLPVSGVAHHGAQTTHKNFRYISVAYANPMINNRKTNARKNMALPAGGQLLTVEVQVRSPGSPCSIGSGQSGTAHISPRYFTLPHPLSFHQFPTFQHLSSVAHTTCTQVDTVPRTSVSKDPQN